MEEELDDVKRDYILKLEFGLQRANKMGRDAEKENQQLKQQLAESEKENNALKNIRTLERVIPKNTQLNKLSNRDCYLKGFDNAISETIRVFEESYGKDKTELIEERNEYLSDIVKVGGYRHQIKELKQQLEEKDKEKFKSMYFNKCLDFEHLHEEFVDKCNEFELKEYDYKQTIFEKNQDKISFCIEQLEKVKMYIDDNAYYVEEENFGIEINEYIDNQINVLRNNKDGMH